MRLNKEQAVSDQSLSFGTLQKESSFTRETENETELSLPPTKCVDSSCTLGAQASDRPPTGRVGTGSPLRDLRVTVPSDTRALPPDIN